MQTIVAETTKPPAYPFIIHQCQRTDTKKQQTTEPTQLSPGQLAVHPIMSNFRVAASAYQPVRFFRRFRFGEAVSRVWRRGAQEEKWQAVIFLLPAHVLLGFWQQAPSNASPPGLWITRRSVDKS